MSNPIWLNKYSNGDSVIKAYEFAKKVHDGFDRASGKPYVHHCTEVAKTLDEWGLDKNTVAAGFLHDSLKRDSCSIKDIKKKFGQDIASLVEGVTKIGDLNYRGDFNSKDQQMENIRKLMIAISNDLRVIFIKLSDRLHNMKTLDYLNEARQKEKAQETYDIYAPLAYRLGMQKLAGELKDITFPYINPEEYEWLLNNVEQEYKEREKYIEKVKPILKEKLKKEDLEPVEITARAKRYSSLYKKLLRKDRAIEEIYDLVALRVIVENVEQCYKALGIIHEQWSPLPGRIKDYIARPKPNGYQSLHTTVFCVNNEITEIQIRTKKMHEEAELGAAAHWAYQQSKDSKSSSNSQQKAEEENMRWVRQLRNWKDDSRESEEFIDSVKGEFFEDKIFVLTPDNDVIDLPSGSTPVDFAYRIHSEIGNQCSGAKVNGKMVSLDYELESGDLVKIMTQPSKLPSEDWLDFVKTSTARSHIKEALRQKRQV